MCIVLSSRVTWSWNCVRSRSLLFSRMETSVTTGRCVNLEVVALCSVLKKGRPVMMMNMYQNGNVSMYNNSVFWFSQTHSDTEVYLQTEILYLSVWFRLVLFCSIWRWLEYFYCVVLAVNIYVYLIMWYVFYSRSGYCESCSLFYFFINVYRMNTYQCCKILMLFKIWILLISFRNMQCSFFFMVVQCHFGVWLCNIITTRVVIIGVCGKLDKVWPDLRCLIIWWL